VTVPVVVRLSALASDARSTARSTIKDGFHGFLFSLRWYDAQPVSHRQLLPESPHEDVHAKPEAAIGCAKASGDGNDCPDQRHHRGSPVR
jgi:hypothetical protein